MSDVETTEEQKAADAEKAAQRKHVLETAQSNLAVVTDQLESLEDSTVEIVLEALDTAKNDLEKLINGNAKTVG